MTLTLKPGERSGRVTIPASKSQAHRLLICAALGADETELSCRGISADIEATARCLSALGAEIRCRGETLYVKPISAALEGKCELFCGESGSTLRFLLPVVGALGANAVFHMEGRLPQRPLAPLDKELEAHGMRIRREGALLYCSGRLAPGSYTISGDVSSQYISGLLMALPLLDGESSIEVTGKLESAAYVAMTEDALKLANVCFEKDGQRYTVPGGQRFALQTKCSVEGDWSNAAFFLCMGAVSASGVTVDGLNTASSQGDSAVLDILRRFGADVRSSENAVLVRRGELRGIELDAAPIPDLIPVLSVLAAVSAGETRVINAARLRLKESDRLSSTARLISALGGEVTELESGLVIKGREKLSGGTADPCRDHRIAMAAAVAACASSDPVTVPEAECVGKSYPRFWEDFESLNTEVSE